MYTRFAYYERAEEVASEEWEVGTCPSSATIILETKRRCTSTSIQLWNFQTGFINVWYYYISPHQHPTPARTSGLRIICTHLDHPTPLLLNWIEHPLIQSPPHPTPLQYPSITIGAHHAFNQKALFLSPLAIGSKPSSMGEDWLGLGRAHICTWSSER